MNLMIDFFFFFTQYLPVRKKIRWEKKQILSNYYLTTTTTHYFFNVFSRSFFASSLNPEPFTNILLNSACLRDFFALILCEFLSIINISNSLPAILWNPWLWLNFFTTTSLGYEATLWMKFDICSVGACVYFFWPNLRFWGAGAGMMMIV